MDRSLAGTIGKGGPARPVSWPLLTALAPLLLLMTVVSCGGAADGENAEVPAPGAGEEVAAAVDLEHPSLGDEDAPVVLTEYADYQ